MVKIAGVVVVVVKLNSIQVKLSGPNFFFYQNPYIVWILNLFYQNLFEKNNSGLNFSPKFIWPKVFLTQNFDSKVLQSTFFSTQNFFDQHFFEWKKNCFLIKFFF